MLTCLRRHGGKVAFSSSDSAGTRRKLIRVARLTWLQSCDVFDTSLRRDIHARYSEFPLNLGSHLCCRDEQDGYNMG